MNQEEVDRWIRLEGPEPEEIKKYMDAAREPPPMSPELEARLERNLLAKLAEERRKRARARLANVARAGFATAAAAAALWTLYIVFWVKPLHDSSAPNVKLPAEPIPAGAPSADAGAPANSAPPQRGRPHR